MKRILVAANDPGGANAIAPVVKKLISQGDLVLPLVTGPAVTIFQQQGIVCEESTSSTSDDLKKQILAFSPSVFLAGTSGGQSLDKQIMDLVGETVPSIYVLDFWGNYSSRFSKEEHGFEYLPDKVCVMDELAKQEMMAESIEEKRIVVTGNPYFEHFAESITRDQEDKYQVLFISQPISTSPENDFGCTEYDSLEGLVEVLENLPQEYHLSIRLHPRDAIYKYEQYLGKRVKISDADTLEQALSESHYVVGLFSPVLMQAALGGKQVLRYMPHPIKAFAEIFADIAPLITSKKELEVRLTDLTQGNSHHTLPSGWVVPGATENVLRALYAL